MPIPAEILAVERPKSTKVKKSGDRWLVIKRTCKRVNGKPRAVDLGTIGEIIDGKYVEIRKEPRKKKIDTIDVKDYGEFALCNKAAGGLLQELADTFDIRTAKRLYVIAALRSSYIDIKNRDIQFAYETSFASEMFPGLALSENTISSFLEKVGMEYRYIHAFMKKRVESMTGGNIVIDGMLKDNNSITNSYSEFSRKGAKKGSKDISLMYAYDTASKEPIAVKPYAGNVLDQRAIEDFVTGLSFKKGLMILDKGFFTKESFDKLKQIDGLSYIVPLKRSSSLVTGNGMLDSICTPLDGYKDAVVFYKKKKVAEDCFLYAFRDPRSASEQEIGYVVHGQKKGTFSADRLAGKQSEFGTIVFLSKSDLEPLDVYEAYMKRWEIEVMFSLYKDIIDLDTVNVQGDYRMYATELINFLSTIITTRVKRFLSQTKVEVSEKKNGEKVMKEISKLYSYRQVMHYLSKCKRVRTEENGTWLSNRKVKYVSKLSEALGLGV